MLLDSHFESGGLRMSSNELLPVPPFKGAIFDGDTHIVEKDFSMFDKYLPRKYHKDWLIARRYGPDGKFGIYVGDRLSQISEAYPDDLVPPPGKLKQWLAAVKAGRPTVEGYVKRTPDMYDPQARLAKLDEFGVDGSILFIGNFVSVMGYLDEPEAGHACLHAYNEYLNEVWTFNLKDRIYPTACLALWNLDKAIEEAEWLIKRGVRVVIMPMGPANGRSAADPCYDPVWARLNEAGVLVTYHVSEARFMHGLVREFGEQPMQSRRLGQTAWQWMYTYSEVPVMMSLSNLIFNNLFGRFPNLRMGSVENGAEWLPRFLDKMDKMRGMAKNGYWPGGQLKQRPSEIFKQHCFAVAYPEDDVRKIVAEIGTADCILMGSDYPHAEGVPTPMDFVSEACRGLSEADTQKIMHDNGRRFLPARN
jgi:predicted TIM-barrel fold metal-dependent hydrolase